MKMSSNLSPIRDEHQEMQPHIASLKSVADWIDLTPPQELKRQLTEGADFLNRRLMPHAVAEEEVLYRAYDQVAGSPWASDTMRREHTEIEKLAGELSTFATVAPMDELTIEARRDLRRIVLGLYALLHMHFRHEEEQILPRLEDAITQEAADQIIASMTDIERRQQASAA
jgi:hypothetical protein